MSEPSSQVTTDKQISSIGQITQAWSRWRTTLIAILALLCILAYLAIQYFQLANWGLNPNWPLWIALLVGGIPLVSELFLGALKFKFGADLLGGISIIVSILLGEYLAGAIIVLMLSGGEALESYALSNASSVLSALAKRLPAVAHRRRADKPDSTDIETVPLAELRVGDAVVVYPHDVAPIDGLVIEGHSVMDESYLTGEPFKITKTKGSNVISGAVNGDGVLVIEATHVASDSRYARIMEVMQESQQTRPQMRRLGDQLGAWFTPVALLVATIAWALSNDPSRFLSVLVVATPCPLLLAIPIAILGSISLCASRSIIVKNPVALEQVPSVRTAIFDKTGTLTYGEPTLTKQVVAPNYQANRILSLVASIERYSKHPLANAILKAAELEHLPTLPANSVSEEPGKGLTGFVDGHRITVTSRKKALENQASGLNNMPQTSSGLECVILLDGTYVATYQMHDAPRADSKAFVNHLAGNHRITKTMIVSGDRESEVKYLAEQVGIGTVLSQQSPEQKLEIVRAETKQAKTLYVGDGINDAPAMMAASVGVAIGQGSDVTAQAADVVVMDNKLAKVDEFMHIGRRMRTIVLQSALGGMALSILAMLAACFGLLNPVSGAIFQEVVDVLAVLNALRAAWPPKLLSDMH
ncbi:MAG: Zinc-transporting ATPase [Planctomycetota bacterium]|jgi:heavy metal translocating P-type ATPase